METTVLKVRQNIIAPLLLLILINVHRTASDMLLDMDYINDTFSELCPYTSFCGQSSSRQLQSKSKMPCCFPCSCNTDCHLRGNCCPDVNPHNSIEPSLKCQAALLTNAPSTSITLNDFDSRFSYYYIIDTCPVGYRNREVVDKCINPRFNRLQDVRDVVTVSISERIYSNRHCAQCNNEITFNMWTPVLYNFDSSFNSSDQTLAPAEYILKFSPLSDKQAKLSQCFPEFINKCNTTGFWATYDYHLVKACDEINSYYVDEWYRTKIFKNVYCFLCNSNQFNKRKNTCQGRNDIGGKSEGTVPDTTAFVVILDISDWYTPALRQDTSLHDHACSPQDQLYDEQFGVCRQLYCPILSVPIGGQCVSPYLGAVDVSISVVFKLIADDEADLGEVDFTTAKRINTNAMRAIGLTAQGCAECENVFASQQKGNSTNMFLYVSFRITSSCTVQTVIDTYRDITTNQIQFRVQIQNKPVAFIAHFTYEFSTFGEFFDLKKDENGKLFTAADMLPCYMHQGILNDRFCEYIELSIQEYNTLMNRSHPRVHSSDFRLVTNEDNGIPGYRVCTEDYFLEPTDNGAGSPLLILTMSHVTLLTCSAVLVCMKLLLD